MIASMALDGSQLLVGVNPAGMNQVVTNCAPAISADGSTIYVAMSTGNFGTGRIVATFQMTPCRADPCHLYQPDASYVAAVEMNAGLLAAKGVRPGDRATFTRGP